MNKTEERKIEKALIEKINKEEVGSDAHRKALQELLVFQKQQEEIRKNLENEQIDKDKIDVERQKIESQETVAKCQRDLDEERLKQEKEIEAIKERIERRTRINNILTAIIGVFGSIGGTIIGYKLFDKQATKAYKFEETGTISSFTSRQVMSGLKPPKK